MMGFDEDSLVDSEEKQAASEITCSEYLKKFEVDHASQGSTGDTHQQNESTIPHVIGTSNTNATTLPSGGCDNKDSYMWKVVHKRDRPGQSLNMEAGFWGNNWSSQKPINLDLDYTRNWQLMQSYFYWDVPLPASKKLKITEIEMNCHPLEQVHELPKDIHVIEEQDKTNITRSHPHQWFSGEGSSATQANVDPKAKGKGIAKFG